MPFVHAEGLLGSFEAEVCPSCGEILFTEGSSELINRRAKELGLWGLMPRIDEGSPVTSALEAGQIQSWIVTLSSSQAKGRRRTKGLTVPLLAKTV